MPDVRPITAAAAPDTAQSRPQRAEILRLWRAGSDPADIAQRLGLAVEVVESVLLETAFGF